MTPNFENRTLYCGDNLEFLRGINSGTVNLIATDPPFNKGRDFQARGASFTDRWSWGADVQPEWVEAIKDSGPGGWAVIEAARAAYGDDMGAFLCWLGVRVLEMRRIMRPDGSLYLHIDHTAQAWVKTLLDAIFGKANFRNEIVWAYPASPSTVRKDFPRKHDTLLRYTKGKNWTFNADAVRVPYAESSLERIKYPAKSSTVIGGTEIQLQEGGKIPPSVWNDIQQAYRYRNENTGYPTQKPLALYERIIRASSNLGDIVLDPFCGCGTTLVAAEWLGRQWVGMDISAQAHQMVLDRLASAGLTAPDAAIYATAPPVRTDL